MSEPARRRSAQSAAREYKDVLAGLTTAADELRERDRERVVALSRRLGELEEAMMRVGERAALTRFGVALHWEAALEALWAESWMRLQPQPTPDLRADPAHLEALDVAVAERAAELHEAVRKRLFSRRPQLGASPDQTATWSPVAVFGGVPNRDR